MTSEAEIEAIFGVNNIAEAVVMEPAPKMVKVVMAARLPTFDNLKKLFIMNFTIFTNFSCFIDKICHTF